MDEGHPNPPFAGADPKAPECLVGDRSWGPNLASGLSVSPGSSLPSAEMSNQQMLIIWEEMVTCTRGGDWISVG